MGKYTDYYCGNGNKRLKHLVDSLLSNSFAWIPQKDYDDFYSIAGETVWRCEQNFDNTKGAKFETYFINCLLKKIKTRVTYMNRDKRKAKDRSGNIVGDISLDSIIDEDGNLTFGDLIIECETNVDDDYGDGLRRYLSRLGKKQRQILLLSIDGFSSEEIRAKLQLSSRKYTDLLKSIYSFENICVLKRTEE